jgi:hypothetical protein
MDASSVFDRVARTAARRTIDRRTLLKAGGVAAAAIALEPAMPDASWAAQVCDQNCLRIEGKHCINKYLGDLIKCAGTCALAETGVGAAICIACVSVATEQELTCLDEATLKCCHCQDGNACPRGYFLGLQCCSADQECTKWGCSAKCDTCLVRDWTNACVPLCSESEHLCVVPTADGTTCTCCSEHNLCLAGACTTCREGTRACADAFGGYGCCGDVGSICFIARGGFSACCIPGASTCTTDVCDAGDLPLACCNNPEICDQSRAAFLRGG